jgi:hypothetical protein
MRNGLISIGVVALLFLFGAGCSSVAETEEETVPSPDDRIQQTLERELHAEVLDRLHLLDQAVLSPAAHAAAVGPDDPSTYEVLANVTDTFSHCVNSFEISAPFRALVISVDGLILYSPDEEEIGEVLFSDPGYALFVDVGRFMTRIGVEERGSATVGLSGVQKQIIWDTVSLHGTDWRLLVVKEW